MLYALKGPMGVIIESTVTNDRGTAWGYAFDYLTENGCGNLLSYSSDGLEHEIDSSVPQHKSKYYGRRYWKDIKGSMDYARKHGWRIVEVRAVEVTS